MISTRRATFVLLGFIWLSCSDAPHDNPLDPHSTAYSGNTSLSGKVTILNEGTAIAGATVSSLEDSISVVSDANGAYNFSRIGAGTKTVVCRFSGYVGDTSRVSCEPGANAVLNFSLNGVPVVLSASILTRKIDQYYPSPQYYVDISASVTDPNGITDVDSVWFAVDTLTYPMTYSVNTKEFVTTIYKYDLPTNTIQWLVGKPLSIVGIDFSKATGVSAPFYVTRIIEDGATPLSPSPFQNDTTTSTPLFTWSPPNVTFSYTYTVIVSQVNSGTETVAWTYAGLDSYYEQLQYPTDGSVPSLAPGSYVWTISVIDAFGNFMRSKESAFLVQ
ncbi:MAG TPA: carboxypeptidase-like regulatory domain-containing protein [Bacteroidota bacterium]|nr:carboxypeptidase-like regulatory domain-containing protein [Bacteroidota bacterium]